MQTKYCAKEMSYWEQLLSQPWKRLFSSVNFSWSPQTRWKLWSSLPYYFSKFYTCLLVLVFGYLHELISCVCFRLALLQALPRHRAMERILTLKKFRKAQRRTTTLAERWLQTFIKCKRMSTEKIQARYLNGAHFFKQLFSAASSVCINDCLM